MSETRPNQSAHPYFWDHGNGLTEADSGLTKREYFAAKAMEGILSANPKIHTDPNNSIEDWCNRSVKYADALIEELNK